MQLHIRSLSVLSIGLATIGFGCSELPGAPGSSTGAIQISTSVTGALLDRDPDGFTVTIDDGVALRIPVTGLAVNKLKVGSHSVTIGGVAANCSVSGANPRVVDVTARDAAVPVPIEVACAPNVGSLKISAVTTGEEVDQRGYTVLLPSKARIIVPANGSVTVPDMRAGALNLSLNNVAPNCDQDGATVLFTQIAYGATTDVAFTLRCVATGRLEVRTTTSGMDVDADGYTVEVSLPVKGTHDLYTVPASGVTNFPGLRSGAYTMRLSGIANNCVATQSVLGAVAVVAGNATAAAFDLNCTEAKQIAYASPSGTGSKIRTIKSNQTEVFQVTSEARSDFDPDWSPDGSRIAFTSDREGSRDIYAMDSDGGHVVRLTGGTGFNYRPAWSPDGQRILFVRNRDGNTEIYVMDADGGNPVRITNNPLMDDAPSWSADGKRIVFQSNRGGLQRIWIMNSDGSGALPMPFSVDGDRQPAWSPDGNKIAFARISAPGSRNIYTADIDGSNLRQITFNYPDASDPTWSPDGLQIGYSATYCDQSGFYYYYSDCDVQILLARTDNKLLSSTPVLAKGYNPAWRR